MFINILYPLLEDEQILIEIVQTNLMLLLLFLSILKLFYMMLISIVESSLIRNQMVLFIEINVLSISNVLIVIHFQKYENLLQIFNFKSLVEDL
jgi:hypothetical protein